MSSTQKVTLSLNRKILETLSKKSGKSMSEFVRDLIMREKELTDDEFSISEEINELRGSLPARRSSSKDRIHRSAASKIRNYERS